MNPDTNKFEELQEVTKESNQLEKKYKEMSGQLIRPNGDPVPKHWSIFHIGENYVINNYTFKCAYIGETSILFEPVGIVEVDNDQQTIDEVYNKYLEKYSELNDQK